MLKKSLLLIFVVFFFAVCMVPSVMMLFGTETVSSEKRELSEFPSFADENGINLNWTAEFETYVSEHFGFRGALVTADSLIKAKLFSTSSVEKVIIGKDGWLFFNETVRDYTGRSLMTERQIFSIVHTLELIDEYCASNGIEFVFVCAPNKNSVYPEYMPSRYIKADISNYDLIYKALTDTDVNFVDAKSAVTASDKILYHKRDSHWTNEGAVLIYNLLLDNVGIEHYDYSDTATQEVMDWDGDLDGMLFPSLGLKDMQTEYEYEFNYTYTSRFKTVEDITIKTRTEGKSGKLLMFRDSFTNSMLPFMAEAFGEAEFSRALPYALYTAADNGTSCVIIELVERNLKNLLLYAPIFDAPSQEICDIMKQNEISAVYNTENVSGYLKVTGSLSETETETRIFLLSDNQMYEAIPDGENGFTAYLPPEIENFRIIYENGGIFYYAA